MAHVQACPRHPVAKLIPLLIATGKYKYVEQLEQNQLLSSCCRHPENHEVEALKSNEEQQAPDIYIFHCSCGNKHRFFCVGGGDARPIWEIR